MNKRIQELEGHYRNIALKKRFVANAAVLNPDVSGVISDTYKVMEELHKKVYQEIQDAKQQEFKQNLLDTTTKAEVGKSVVDSITDILQNEANRTGEKVIYNIGTCELIFRGVFYPEPEVKEEHF